LLERFLSFYSVESMVALPAYFSGTARIVDARSLTFAACLARTGKASRKCRSNRLLSARPNAPVTVRGGM